MQVNFVQGGEGGWNHAPCKYSSNFRPAEKTITPGLINNGNFSLCVFMALGPEHNDMSVLKLSGKQRLSITLHQAMSPLGSWRRDMFKKLSCSNQVVLLLGVSYPHGIVVVPSRFRGLDVAKKYKMQEWPTSCCCKLRLSRRKSTGLTSRSMSVFAKHHSTPCIINQGRQTLTLPKQMR